MIKINLVQNFLAVAAKSPVFDDHSTPAATDKNSNSNSNIIEKMYITYDQDQFGPESW